MTTESKSNTLKEQSKKKRDQLDHALFDVDFFHKPTIKALRRKFRCEGLCAYQELIFQISRATNAEIDDECALASIEEFGVIESAAFLEYCLSQNLISRSESGKLSQERVIEDQEACARKRERWRKEKGQDSGIASVPESIPETTPDSARKCEQLNTEDLKDLKKKNGEGRAERAPCVFLSDIEFEQGLCEYVRAGLNKAWAERGLLHTARHLSKPENAGLAAYVHWVTWALRECLNDQKAGLDAKTAKARNEIAKNDPRGQNRPRPPLVTKHQEMGSQARALVDMVVPSLQMPEGKCS